MPADNVEVFKKVIFHLPKLEDTLKLTAVTAFFYASILFLLLQERFDLMFNELAIPVIGLLLFVVPGVISSEAYTFCLPEYPRKWGYFLSLINQLIIFLFTALLAFSESFGTAWNILWLGLTTLYASNFFILVLSNGPLMKKISVLSMIQPVLILSGFHVLFGRYLEIGLVSYLMNFLIVIGTGIVLLLAFYLTEFLVGSNVSNISIIDLATALLQNRQEKLEIGREVRPDVQTLEIENSSGVKKFLAPWLHPGPLQGFGGGQITGKIIEDLNSEGEGFFLHVPSCHQMDPTDPKDAEKVLQASNSPDKNSEASKLVKAEYDFCTFYGRKVGDQKIVFLEIKGFDDYDSAVFQPFIDKEEVLLIDLHNQPKSCREGEMRYGTAKAQQAQKNLGKFLEELEKLPQEKYSAGFSSRTDGKPAMALVEQVGDQRTVIFGVEGNDASRKLLELEAELKQEFDEALLFTTDTHASIHDLASERQLEKSEIRKIVDEASSDLSEASIGFSVEKAEEMKFLTDKYFGLIYTINILVRLIPIMLLALYILLVVWLI